jgi:hypothetical protein
LPIIPHAEVCVRPLQVILQSAENKEGKNEQTSATLLFAAPAIATFAWSAQLAAEHPFMNLTTCFRVLIVTGDKQDQQGTTEMRNLIFGAAGALALASPAVASDLPVTSYSESYARSYEYRTSPVVIEESAPVVSETLVVRRPVIVAPPRVVVEEYPVYATPRVFAAPRAYAYEGPGWHGGWGHRRHFHGGLVKSR